MAIRRLAGRVDEKHRRRLKPLGGMDGHHAHGVGKRRRGLVRRVLAGSGEALQLSVEPAQRRIAALVGIEHALQKGAEIRAYAPIARQRGLVARSGAELGIDAVDEVVRGEAPRGREPVRELPGRPLQRRAGESLGRERLQALPPVALRAGLGELHEVVIAGRKQRRAQHVRKIEIAARAVEQAQQRHEVLREHGVEQSALARADKGNAARRERLLDAVQMRALAREDHDVAGADRACRVAVDDWQPCREQRLDALRDPRALGREAQILERAPRRGQRIAQTAARSRVLVRRIGFLARAGDQCRDLDRAPVAAAMRLVRLEVDGRAGLAAEQRVDEVDDRRRAAPRGV